MAVELKRRSSLAVSRGRIRAGDPGRRCALLRLATAREAASGLRFTFLLIALAFLAGCQREHVETLTIKGETFTVELATTPEARRVGLSGREEFPEGTAMLFVFPEPQMQGFWMVDCLMDIDIIYLDPRGFVTKTHRMKAEPLQQPHESEAQYHARLPRYSSVYPAQFAIELPAGSLDRLNVRVDEKIDLDLDRLKALAE